MQGRFVGWWDRLGRVNKVFIFAALTVVIYILVATAVG